MARPFVPNRVVVRGAGEMASGVIRCLFTAGFEVIALEQPSPTCVRRYVSFAEAFFEKEISIEGVTSVLVDSAEEAIGTITRRCVPLLIDPNAGLLPILEPMAVVDGRMLKEKADSASYAAPIAIGLGPGFAAGENCQTVIETNRESDPGRIIYSGSARSYTGVPSPVNGISLDRVLRSPAEGKFNSFCKITDSVKSGQVIGEVASISIASRIDGIVRGLIRDGLTVTVNQKLGDVDPRGIREYCYKMSDKAKAIGRGTLEALMSLRAGIAEP